MSETRGGLTFVYVCAKVFRTKDKYDDAVLSDSVLSMGYFETEP